MILNCSLDDSNRSNNQSSPCKRIFFHSLERNFFRRFFYIFVTAIFFVLIPINIRAKVEVSDAKFEISAAAIRQLELEAKTKKEWGSIEVAKDSDLDDDYLLSSDHDYLLDSDYSLDAGEVAYENNTTEVMEKKGEQKCISSEVVEMEKLLKRYVINSERQVTMPLTIVNSDRISHRIANAIFKIFLQEGVGYQEVKLSDYDDSRSAEHRYYRDSDDLEMRYEESMVNLEVWEPAAGAHLMHDQERMVNRGTQGIGGRYGWYIWMGSMKKTEFILEHWRSYQDEKIAQLFALGAKRLDQLKTFFTKDRYGNHYCCNDICVNGIYTPEICKKKKCGILFSGHFENSAFLIEQVLKQHLLIEIAWVGPNLTPEFIQRVLGPKPMLFFSWWPNPNTVLENLQRISFPSCTDVKAKSKSYLCKYEMHSIKKIAWKKLERYGKLAYDTTQRFILLENDYHDLLVAYNKKTSFVGNESRYLVQHHLERGWDDDIVEGVACRWLNQTATKNVQKIRAWRPYHFNYKTRLWFAGIFPVIDSGGKYAQRTLMHAAGMAISDINKNESILKDYHLSLNADNGGCSSDEVLRAFIRYIRTPSLEVNQLIGIVGPSCSDTVEPLAGIAKLLKTVIISYSAEGAIINDQDKYPYFFRTIPENIMYRHVYLQLFRELKWKRLASLTEDGNKYSEYLTLLQDNLQAENITIFNRKFPREARKDMATYLKFLKDEHYHIIIGDFYSDMSCEILCKAYKLGMTAKHGFVWFLPSWLAPKWYTKCKAGVDFKDVCSVEHILEALDGHLSLGYAYYAADDYVFHSGNSVAQWRKRYEEKYALSDYAGYTYDAIWTYAFALDKLLKEKFTHAANLHSANTTERFVELLRETDFRGVSGRINFLRGSSRKGIISIMQSRSNFSTQVLHRTIVGYFSPDHAAKDGGTLHLNVSSIKWLTKGGLQPGDGSLPEVLCALETFSKLLSISCEFTIVVAMLISFAIFACVVIALFCVYRIKLHLNVSSIKWLTKDGLQPGDGSPPEVLCALETFSKLLSISCEFTIVVAMLISFAIFACVVIALFCVYRIKYEKFDAFPWQLSNFMNLDEWEIPKERVVINRTIGSGAFGTVYGGECMIDENGPWRAVAVKTLKKGSTCDNKLDFLGEAEMMKRFDQENIVKLLGLSTRDEPIYMIIELMLYGDLQMYLLGRRHLVSERTYYNDDDEVSSRRLTSMALDAASALKYLAANHYVHRDVACRNCLINANRVVKLSDFGMTRPVYENNYYRFTRKGMLPVRWMAPESIEDGLYTTMTDVWSYGVLLYEIITFGNFPFQGLSNNEVLEHVAKKRKTIKIPEGIRPEL